MRFARRRFGYSRIAPEHVAAAAAGSAGAGALAMYLFDPQRGRARRAWLIEQARGTQHRVRDFAGDMAHDAAQRSRGIYARVRSRLSRTEVSPETLAERVRARIGRIAAHRGGIEIAVQDGGVVQVSGSALRAEVGQLLSAIWAVDGVSDVDNRLLLHDSADGVPELQGDSRAAGRRSGWPLSLRLVAGGLGAGAALLGARQGRFGYVGSALGAAVLLGALFGARKPLRGNTQSAESTAARDRGVSEPAAASPREALH